MWGSEARADCKTQCPLQKPRPLGQCDISLRHFYLAFPRALTFLLKATDKRLKQRKAHLGVKEGKRCKSGVKQN